MGKINLTQKTTMSIRKARPEEAELLTDLSFASKRYWKYPETLFDVWRSELTITIEYVNRNEVYVCQGHGEIVGYYSLVTHEQDLLLGHIVLPAGTWLEHMFVKPTVIGCGIGSDLFAHMQQWCCDKGITLLQVLADPHARGFYEKMGCSYLGEFPSIIAGRTTPWLTLDVDRRAHDLKSISAKSTGM
jgi:GNAT superfamily N-acetyltransferase